MKANSVGSTTDSQESAGARLLRRITASRTNYWASYVTDFGCIFVFAFLGRGQHLSWPIIVTAFVAGVFIFTLMEYSIHRWLLHDERSILFPLHAAHHEDPENASAFLFPTSLVVLLGVWYLTAHLLHWHASAFVICGIASGYSYYGILHHVEHTTRINHIPFRWLQSRWAAHSVHHRLDQTNYGVITSMWDHVFHTRPRSKGKRHARPI